MIVFCGEALVDMVPDGDRADAFLARPGGCPYNSAIAAARLGADCAFLGRLGRDFFGELLFARLGDNGVDRSMTVRSEQSATLAFVRREPSGDARYAFYSNGAADRSLAPADLPPSLGAAARYLMAGSISMLQEPLASTVEGLLARESGRLLVSIDPNIRPGLIQDREAYVARLRRWVGMSAIVKISSDDLGWLWPGRGVADCAQELLGMGPELVVATLGTEGALALTAEARASAPGFRVEVADTIGAGDTFHAALLASLDAAGVRSRADLRRLGSDWLAAALRRANAAAALDCTRSGAEPPLAAELAAFLEER